MAEDIPRFWELDYLGDFTLYQHPPCMFILWYIALAVTAAAPKIKELIDSLMEGGEGGGGGGEGGEGDDGGDGGGEGEGGGDDAGGEEAPAEEGGGEEEG